MKWQRRYTGLCLDCCSCQVGEGVMQFIGLSWRDSCHAESGRIYSRVTKERMTNWKLSCAYSCCRHYTDGMLHRGVRSSVWNYSLAVVPKGSPSRGGDVTVHVWHKPAELTHSSLFCSCVYFCLYGPFNCISFHKFSPTTLRFLILFFQSYLCLIGPFNYISLCESFFQPWYNS